VNEPHESAARLPRLTKWELIWCQHFNRAVDRRSIACFFALISRLGDGIFWYLLMIFLLLVDGRTALPAVVNMLAAGGISLILYKWLKTKTSRPRPCTRNASIRITVAPLDQYSFPSGHTLHAVAFSMVTVEYYPGLIWLVLPFTTLVALSRLVLGLHYPSDVVIGALIGAALSTLVLQF